MISPHTLAGNPMTCSELIYAAKSYETDSDWCESREVDAAYCCPTEPEDPCAICPWGAFAGDNFIPRPLSGSSKTCREIIEFARLFESGSRQCEMSKADETLCCPIIPVPVTTPVSSYISVTRMLWHGYFTCFIIGCILLCQLSLSKQVAQHYRSNSNRSYFRRSVSFLKVDVPQFLLYEPFLF